MEEIYAAYQSAYKNPEGGQGEEALAFINEWFSTPDSIALIAASFEAINDKDFANFLLTLAQRFLKYRWEEIAPEIIEQLKNVILNPELDTKFGADPKLVNSIAHTRVCIMWQLYPEAMPDFWQVLSNYSEVATIAFLNEFAAFPQGFMSQENRKRYTIIKDKMREDGSDDFVVKYVLEALSNGKEICFTILGYIMKWINLDFIIAETPLTLIHSGLEKGTQVAAEVLSIYKTIIKRGMPDEKRQEIMSVINVFEISGTVSQREDFGKLAEPLAALVEAFGFYAIQYGAAEGYLELAMQFFQEIQVDQGCVAISPLIDSFIKCDASIVADLLGILVGRLALVFGAEDYDPFEGEAPIFESLQKLAKTCLSQNEEDTNGFFMTALQSIDFEDLPTVASLLFLSTSVFSNKKYIEQRKAITDSFFCLLEVEDLESPLLFKIYYMFIKFFITVADIYDVEHRTAVYNSLAQKTQVEAEWHELILDELTNFVKQNGTKIQFDPENIAVFLQQREPSTVAIAGMLVRTLTDQRQEFFQQCMGWLTDILNSEEDMRVENCKLILQFVRSITYAQGSPHIEPVKEFLASIFELACTDDSILSIFTRTVYASLEHEGLEILYNIMRVDTKEVHSYEELSNAFKALLTSKIYTDHSWAKDVIPALIEPVIGIYNSISALEWDAPELGFKNKEIIQMTVSFIELVSRAIDAEHREEELLDAESIQKINEFVYSALTNQYEHPIVIAPMISYVRSILPLNPEEFIPPFIETTLSCLNTRRFDPSSKEWTPVVKVLVELHHEMHSLSDGAVDELLHQYFISLLPEEDEMITDYITKMGATSEQYLDRHRRKDGKDFYLRVSRILNSIDK